MSGERFKNFDSADMRGHIYRFPEQLEEAIEIGRKIQLNRSYSSVRAIGFAGMGGSAIAGDILMALTYQSLKIPMFVTRNYSLPSWIRRDTLIILLSYSGDTEETLSCLDDALGKRARVAGITSGGELKKRLIELGADVVSIPPGFPPRASLGYLSIPLLYFLRQAGLMSESMEKLLPGVVEQLKIYRDIFCKADENNRAYQIANSIHHSIPVIYGEADSTAAVALRWRTQLEENGKMIAFHHILPEMNHNEIMGYENNPELLKKISVLWLIDRGNHSRIQKRQQLTREIIGNMAKCQMNVESCGETGIERLFYLIYLGDWVSFWAAMLHGTDPSPVAKIDRLKLSLSE